jgi:hypothetical protein
VTLPIEISMVIFKIKFGKSIIINIKMSAAFLRLLKNTAFYGWFLGKPKKNMEKGRSRFTFLKMMDDSFGGSNLGSL